MSQMDSEQGSKKWVELKSLLLEEETHRLDHLEGVVLHPEEFAKSIAEVLAEAVQGTKDKARLSQKLYPIVEQSIYKSVQKDPESLANAIYPVLSPAIRKAINDAIKKITENVNQSVNSGLTAKSLKWRLQSLFTGQSYGEIVLKNSLLYQVAEVYLIHSDTGLLIAHLSQNEGNNPDGDLVSGMLTAIKDFVRDSFKMEKSESLETIEIGGLTVLLEQGPHASLACVVKGDPGKELKQVMNSSLEEIHRQFGPDLINFKGDTSGLADCATLINPCLITKLDKDDQPRKSKMKWVLMGIGFLLLLLLANHTFWGIHWRKLKTSLVEAGQVDVIHAERKGRSFALLGIGSAEIVEIKEDSTRSSRFSAFQSQLLLRHSLGVVDTLRTRIPAKRLHLKLIESGIPNSIEIVLRRIKQIIENDPNLRVQLEEFNGSSSLFLLGNAPAERVRQLKNWLPFFSEGYPIVFDDLVANEHIEMVRLKKEIERILIFFVGGTSKLVPGQEFVIGQLNFFLEEMDRYCQELGESYRLEVSGSADHETGTEEQNENLQNQRALFIIENVLNKNLKAVFANMTPSTEAKKSRVGPLVKKPEEWRHASFELIKVLER